MSFLSLNFRRCSPLTLLNLSVPILQASFICRSRRSRLLLHEIVVVALRFLFVLAVHVLHAVPILLPATSQRLAAVAPHNVTSYLKRTKANQTGTVKEDLNAACGVLTVRR